MNEYHMLRMAEQDNHTSPEVLEVRLEGTLPPPPPASNPFVPTDTSKMKLKARCEFLEKRMNGIQQGLCNLYECIKEVQSAGNEWDATMNAIKQQQNQHTLALEQYHDRLEHAGLEELHCMFIKTEDKRKEDKEAMIQRIHDLKQEHETILKQHARVIETQTLLHKIHTEAIQDLLERCINKEDNNEEDNSEEDSVSPLANEKRRLKKEEKDVI